MAEGRKHAANERNSKVPLMKNFISLRGFLSLIASVCLFALLSACGGGGQAPIFGGENTSITGDITPPRVTSTTQRNGATGVALDIRTGVTFNEAMDTASISAITFTLSHGGVSEAGTVTAAGTYADFKPTNDLAANTVYTATVSTGAKDVTGNPLRSNYVWSWTTGSALDTTAPVVVSTINANGDTNVSISTRVGATFSEIMHPASFSGTNFLLKETISSNPITGTLVISKANAFFTPSAYLTPNTQYTATLKGGVGGVDDLADNVMAVDKVWSWTTGATAEVTPPVVTSVSPANAAVDVETASDIHAAFSEAMDPTTINNNSFTVGGIEGLVSMSNGNTVATFTPSALLSVNTTYTATLSTALKDLSGNSLAANKVWSFTTAGTVATVPSINLASAAVFGVFAGTAGITNSGIQTTISGDIGTTATATSSVTGFHDSLDIFTQTLANIGSVAGTIKTCTVSTTGPTAPGVNATYCNAAKQAALDAQAAYLTLENKPDGIAHLPELGTDTLLPGIYKATEGFKITTGNLTLNGDANAVWVFQMPTTLTVGGPASPRSVLLTGGALAKNVFWQVGSNAVVNAAGGGTMVGTIIAQTGAAFSTAGNTTIVNLSGRVISLGASVTLVDTVITVPAP